MESTFSTMGLFQSKQCFETLKSSMNIEQGKARKKIPHMEEEEVAFHGLMCSRLQGVDSKGLSAHCETLPFMQQRSPRSSVAHRQSGDDAQICTDAAQRCTGVAQT